jgi:hypothetical protein
MDVQVPGGPALLLGDLRLAGRDVPGGLGAADEGGAVPAGAGDPERGGVRGRRAGGAARAAGPVALPHGGPRFRARAAQPRCRRPEPGPAGALRRRRRLPAHRGQGVPPPWVAGPRHHCRLGVALSAGSSPVISWRIYRRVEIKDYYKTGSIRFLEATGVSVSRICCGY